MIFSCASCIEKKYGGTFQADSPSLTRRVHLARVLGGVVECIPFAIGMIAYFGVFGTSSTTNKALLGVGTIVTGAFVGLDLRIVYVKMKNSRSQGVEEDGPAPPPPIDYGFKFKYNDRDKTGKVTVHTDSDNLAKTTQYNTKEYEVSINGQKTPVLVLVTAEGNGLRVDASQSIIYFVRNTRGDSEAYIAKANDDAQITHRLALQETNSLLVQTSPGNVGLYVGNIAVAFNGTQLVRVTN